MIPRLNLELKKRFNKVAAQRHPAKPEHSRAQNKAGHKDGNRYNQEYEQQREMAAAQHQPPESN